MLPKGTILGHYRLLQRIGVGGMGEVYLAEDTRIPRLVAVKVVRSDGEPYPNSSAVQEASRLFQREMKAIATLDHRTILNLIDFGEETIEGMPLTYMIMPYRKEGSLNEWLQRYKTQELLSLDDLDYILSQAAAALQHAHDHQIIHQDVKPPNFLIRENPGNPGRPDLLLTDFGVAKLTNATATASQHVRGTPAYMSPEQWESQPVPATDQYALAVMAYFLLTGRTPFVGRMEQVMRQHLMVVPQPPSTYNPKLSPAIDAVILQALAKKPEDRFPSIEEFARAFHQAIQFSGDLRTTLTISTAEATAGIERSITLPGGRSVSITVPKNAQDGQELHVENQGDAYYEDGPRGSLFLKIAVSPEEAVPVSKHSKENVFPIETSSFPPTVAVPSTSSLERTEPALSDKQNTEKVAPPPLVANRDAHKQSTPRSSPKKRLTILIASLLVIFVLLFALVIGAVHQSSVNNDNANATATANTDNANATADTDNVNATATADTDNANATATADTNNANATATAAIINANPDPYGGGTLALDDPLTHLGNWSNQSNSPFGGSCQFESDGYHITESQNHAFFNCNKSESFNNFVFEVKMTIIRGDCGGMVLRYNSSTGTGYEFFVCSDGSYQLFRYSGSSGSDATILSNGSNSGITSGQNTIAVVANGSTFTLYLNNTPLGNSITDRIYSQGEVGLLSVNNAHTTEVTYKNARLWTL